MFEHLKTFEDLGWEISEARHIDLLWSKRPVLPTTLVDIFDCAYIDNEVEDVDEMDVDWDGTLENENDGHE